MSIQADPKYMGMTSMFGDSYPLDQSVGYGVILGFGAIFALIASLITFLNQKFNFEPVSSEEFNTAGRNIGIGLTACGIVSTWTWAATLLQSANVAFRYGVSGPFWYAAGASIQVLLFGVLAIEVKRKAKNAHTIAEIILSRWGETVHKCFLFFFFLTNLLVMSMLILGGVAVTNALTGIPIEAASFLMPVGFVIYTLVGGLRATIIAGYLNVATIFIIMCICIFEVYAYSKDLGSTGAVWERLVAVISQTDETCEAFGYDPETQVCGKLANNYGGSYLTILSADGLMFGIINVIGNFGTVFCDQSYWQSAIAATPTCAHKGYLLGGLCWFSIPFSFATAVGIAAVALQLPMSFSEAGSGLVPAATAIHLFGNSGGVMILIMVYMAIISTGSAELVSVSSLVSYDIYRTYFNKEATGDDIMRVSRIAIVATGVFMGVFSICLNLLEISLGWVYLFMGVLIGSAVFPVWACLTWKKATGTAAVISVFMGQAFAITAWLVSTSIMYGDITVVTTGNNVPMLCGNVVALCSSFIMMSVISLLDPADYNWDDMNKNIQLIEADAATVAALDPALYDDEMLTNSKAFVMKWGWGMTFVLLICWPILAIPAYDFNKSYFGFWVAISVIWALIASTVSIALPLWEGREGIMNVFNGCIAVLSGGDLSKYETVENNVKVVVDESNVTNRTDSNATLELVNKA
jgi:SSS family transporter